MSRYLDELIRCRCAPDMLVLGLFPNAKEVTESYGAYNAVRTHLRDLALSDPSVTVVAVGDGTTPRTAATFAFRSAWRCISVDPRLRPRWTTPTHGIERLTANACRIEDVDVRCDGPAIVVAVHSHAPLPAAVAAIQAPRIAVVALPCCVQQALPGQPPDIDYRDPSIRSPENRVLVWRAAAPQRSPA